MKRYVNLRNALFLILGAAAVMIIADLAILYSSPRLQKDMQALPVVDSSIFEHSEIADFESAQAPEETTVVWKDLNVPVPPPEKYTVEQGVLLPEPAPLPEITPEPEAIVEAPPAPEPEPEAEPILRHEGEPAKIVIIIDDMGMDRRRSHSVVELSGPLTLAFLPYAPKLEDLTQGAKDKGHELIIHMPMEPMDSSLNPGSIALRSGMSDADIDGMMDKAFASFNGYEGMNNHMGSRLTKDEKAMKRVMAKLKEHKLFFVDSKTIGSSVAAQMAEAAGIKHADRDVFLDHQDTPEFVRSALRQTERVASRKGYAIAIGHPKDSTINALKEWLPGLKERGFELVPVSAVLGTPKKQFAPELLTESNASLVAPAAGPMTVPTSGPVTVSTPPAGTYFGPVRPQALPPG
ncbi:MAG: divergent polysaccharide deacetylase family protein [Alphaproteobacteria bacterium]